VDVKKNGQKYQKRVPKKQGKKCFFTDFSPFPFPFSPNQAFIYIKRKKNAQKYVTIPLGHFVQKPTSKPLLTRP